jgi:uncharacterized repeat protein (TIGR01451 family)
MPTRPTGVRDGLAGRLLSEHHSARPKGNTLLRKLKPRLTYANVVSKGRLITIAGAVLAVMVGVGPGTAFAGTHCAPDAANAAVCAYDIAVPAGQQFSGIVGTYRSTPCDADSGSGPATVTIDWGDGTQTAGVLGTPSESCDGTGTVSGAHTYAHDGSYTVTLAWTFFDGYFDGVISARSTATVTPVAELGITLAGPSSAKYGSTIVYLINVHNDGPSDAHNLRMTDQLPYGTSFQAITAPGWTCQTPSPVIGGGTVTCTATSLRNGGNASSSIAVKVRALPNRGAINNIATISADTPDPQAGNNRAAVSTTVTK